MNTHRVLLICVIIMLYEFSAMSQRAFFRFLKMKMIASETSEIRNCHLAIQEQVSMKSCNIRVKKFSLNKDHLKMLSAQRQPSCLGELNISDALTSTQNDGDIPDISQMAFLYISSIITRISRECISPIWQWTTVGMVNFIVGNG